jgi:secreted trypsin-like serine protease
LQVAHLMIRRQADAAHPGLVMGFLRNVGGVFERKIMKSRTVLAAVSAAAAAAAAVVLAPSAFAIVGGTTAKERYPFIIDLTLSAKDGFPEKHLCGASLVTDRWAVTAAHCVSAPAQEELIVRAGSNDRTQGGEVRQVTKVVVHPEYGPDPENEIINDIALIQLSAPISAAPIAVAAEAPRPGTHTRILGWGRTCAEGCDYATQLKQLDTFVAEPAQCSELNAGKELCTGYPEAGSGACSGDSGGPQVVATGDGRWELVGVTSRDGGRSSSCGQNPTIYTSIAAYAKWITKAVATNS